MKYDFIRYERMIAFKKAVLFAVTALVCALAMAALAVAAGVL